jgi:hypothetical protein
MSLAAVSLLRQAGIANPPRLPGLIRRTIAFLELDLSGLTVLTEAASGPYVVTPIIAALAGAARVFAVTRAARYGTVEAVFAQTQALAELCGVRVGMLGAVPRAGDSNARNASAVEVWMDRPAELFAMADIITNLGFVRPLNTGAIESMKPTAVIPLMCEAWEVRPGDVDLAACRRRGIPVISTNEDYPDLEVFAYSGWLALKLLFDAQIEVHKSRLAVVSSDKFGPVIVARLRRAGAQVRLLPRLTCALPEELAELDALIVADYTRPDLIIGPGGDMPAEAVAAACAGATVIQFAGRVDVAGLTANGVQVYPGVELPARRMALTLAALGPRPVIELHAAGLKVGELAARARLVGRAPDNLDAITLRGRLLGTRIA